jgi:hypothetical protein
VTGTALSPQELIAAGVPLRDGGHATADPILARADLAAELGDEERR